MFFGFIGLYSICFIKIFQNCDLDIRKEMSQNILLVGGCTMIPGFPERLEHELTKLCPPHLKPKVPTLMSQLNPSPNLIIANHSTKSNENFICVSNFRLTYLRIDTMEALLVLLFWRPPRPLRSPFFTDLNTMEGPVLITG